MEENEEPTPNQLLTTPVEELEGVLALVTSHPAIVKSAMRRDPRAGAAAIYAARLAEMPVPALGGEL